MNRVHIVLSLLLALAGLLSSGCSPKATAQGQLSQDQKAERLYQRGEENFQRRKFAAATKFFETAADRPFNRVTTAAIYMAGLSYHRAGESQEALNKFELLKSAYPKSSYLPEANYHKGLILLKRPNKQEAGLWLLLNLADSAASRGLREDAREAALAFFYEDASINFLERYLEKVRPSFKQATLAALAYSLHESGQSDEARELVRTYARKQNGELPAKLQRFTRPKASSLTDQRQLKVAVLMPFNAQKLDTAGGVLSKQRTALEFYTGMKLALERDSFPGLRNLELRAFDTRRSPEHTDSLVREELAAFGPELVIGALYNGTTQALGSYVDTNEIVQLVPFSPSVKLLKDRQRVLLANSTAPTQAEQIAHFVHDSLVGNAALLLTDGSKRAFEAAEAFERRMKKLGGKVVRKQLYAPSSAEEIPGLLNSHSVDAIYMAMFNEDLINASLLSMLEDSVRLPVLGTGAFQHFERVSPDLLYKFQVIFPSNYYPLNDSARLESFRQAYAQEYGHLPERATTQGYDLIRLVLESYGDRAISTSLWEALRQEKTFVGLNQNYRFGGSMDNEAVLMLQFRHNEIVHYRRGW